MAVDMTVAGSDTTALAVSCAVLFLSMHTKEQAYEELHLIFGNSDRDPVIEDLAEMEFIKMVIYETLRLVGVPGVGRKLERDVDLDCYYLPKNTLVFFRFENVHRNSNWWEKPEQFYPEHFTKDAVQRRPKEVFTPFGRGPRSCPGQLLAMVEMKVILSTLLRKFRFSTHLKYEEIRYKYGFMLQPGRTEKSAHPRVPK